VLPPPPGVKVDAPPTTGTSDCKLDHYREHAKVGSCNSCHSKLDSIGFGLENYDMSGQYRTTEADKPACAIDGQGKLIPTMDPVATEGPTFSGPAQLGALLTQSPDFEGCVVQQVYTFAVGRSPGADDVTALTTLRQQFKDSQHAFDGLLLGVVANDGFAFRKEEQ
jgi:hypothetical protein